MAKLSQDAMNFLANNFERYITLLEVVIIVDQNSCKDYSKSIKTVKKMIKKLRKGDDSVFEPDIIARYRDDFERLASKYSGGDDVASW